jgi:gliding motility-associated-like protein
MFIEQVCNDNGTPIDPSDDFYEIIIAVNPENGVNSNEFNLLIDNVQIGVYPYNSNASFTIPADGSTHNISITDVIDNTCTAILVTNVLQVCSSSCDIEASISNIVCSNNGTNNTDVDDIYFFELLVTNTSAGTYMIPSLGLTGNYNQSLNIGPLNIADGNITIIIIDDIQNLCTTSITLQVPPSCSECIETVDAGTGGVLSCTVTSIMLQGTSSVPGTYAWYGPAGNLKGTNLTLSANSVGIYTFEVTFPDGCVEEDTVEIIADTGLPVAIISSTGDLTCETTSVTLDGSASGSSSNFAYYWTNEAGDIISQDPVIMVMDAGVYSLQIEDLSNNCRSAITSVVVESNTTEPSAIIYAEPSNVIDCVIKSIILSTDEQPDVNYIWSLNGEMIQEVVEFEISVTGTYGLLAIDTITGCSNEADIIISSLIEYPIINLEVTDIIDCENSEVTIDASSSQGGPSILTNWLNGAGEVIGSDVDMITVDEAGTYYFASVDTINGCENIDTAFVETFENEVNISVNPIIEVFAGQTVNLNASVNIPNSEIESIEWTPSDNLSCTNCLNPQLTNAMEGEYTITIFDIYGCEGRATINIIEKPIIDISVPNIFNPNSNVGNDKFTLYGNGEVELIIKMQIFDRWGSLVFNADNIEPNNPTLGWDGKFNGKDVVQGVYVYYFSVLISDDTTQQIYGDLTVIR